MKTWTEPILLTLCKIKKGFVRALPTSRPIQISNKYQIKSNETFEYKSYTIPHTTAYRYLFKENFTCYFHDYLSKDMAPQLCVEVLDLRFTALTLWSAKQKTGLDSRLLHAPLSMLRMHGQFTWHPWNITHTHLTAAAHINIWLIFPGNATHIWRML